MSVFSSSKKPFKSIKFFTFLTQKRLLAESRMLWRINYGKAENQLFPGRIFFLNHPFQPFYPVFRQGMGTAVNREAEPIRLL